MALPDFPLHTAGPFRYIDEGTTSDRPPVVLLHGMLGDLSNWEQTVAALAADGHRVLVPLLPVYDLPLKETSVPGLAAFVHHFVTTLQLGPLVLAGNSLGGQVAILYTLTHPDRVAALVLSGASGIYEVEMGSSTPRRQDRSYIRERAALTFYDPVHATDDLVEEMYALVNDRARVTRLIKMARSTKAEGVGGRLGEIQAPTLLIWGRDDRITPPDVAETFESLLPDATLHFIDACGHAPMIEHPHTFNRLFLAFLSDLAPQGTADLPDAAAHTPHPSEL